MQSNIPKEYESQINALYSENRSVQQIKAHVNHNWSVLQAESYNYMRTMTNDQRDFYELKGE